MAQSCPLTPSPRWLRAVWKSDYKEVKADHVKNNPNPNPNTRGECYSLHTCKEYPPPPQFFTFQLSMPPIRIGEPHLQQSFSLDVRPWSHKYSMTVWTSWPKITRPKSPWRLMMWLCLNWQKSSVFIPFPREKKLSEHFQKTSSWHGTLWQSYSCLQLECNFVFNNWSSFESKIEGYYSLHWIL